MKKGKIADNFCFMTSGTTISILTEGHMKAWENFLAALYRILQPSE